MRLSNFNVGSVTKPLMSKVSSFTKNVPNVDTSSLFNASNIPKPDINTDIPKPTIDIPSPNIEIPNIEIPDITI